MFFLEYTHGTYCTLFDLLFKVFVSSFYFLWCEWYKELNGMDLYNDVYTLNIGLEH